MSWLPLKPYKWKMQMSIRDNSVSGDDNKKSNSEPVGEDTISIVLGEPRKPTNEVHSHNYSVVSFVPKFLFIQFQQFANMLFFVLTAIQMIPGLSPFGVQATLVPLLFIMGCSALRELYEDLRRRIRDRQINYQTVWALREDGEWGTIKWSRIHVGQAVRLKNGDQIPSDVLLLSSTEPGGVAYIETANLDGESNLKIRQAPGQTVYLNSDDEVKRFWSTGSTTIVCEKANKNIHEFNGYMTTSHQKCTSDSPLTPTALRSPCDTYPNSATTSADGFQKIPLSVGNLLLRGARLKNTDAVYGIVIYAGKDTKLMKNNTKRKVKRSLVMHITNSIMCMQFGICILLSLAIAVVQRCMPPTDFLVNVFGSGEERSLWFIFLGCLMLFNGFIPISLYVTLEVVQVIQGLFIRKDASMTDFNGKGADVKMFSLNSELGQIRYIMSDKTGTLTQNCMRFRQCSVGGIKYANKKGKRQEAFSAVKMVKQMGTNEKVNGLEIREFLTACSICHTVTPDKNVEGRDRPLYHATSPDESALVEFAAEAGFIFRERYGQQFSMSAMGERHVYELLAILEFSSERKRMSVVVRDDKNVVRIYTKGADHVIFARLKAPHPKVMKRTRGHLQQFATGGYRTLCFGSRIIPEEEYKTWSERYQAASVELTDRSRKTAEVAELIEKDLELIGVSAIEDRLQDQVPETIERLLLSGIRLWVLTGDKLETAINIGNSCRLLSSRMPMLVFARPTMTETRVDLERYLSSLGDYRLATRDLDIALVVDAACLDFLMCDELRLDFLRLALCCSTAICCRCTPIQKAAVTRMVKEAVDGSVLAIGDGANDVAMIQEADVGVGLSGLEGMQASLASDYSISQFSHLDRLLFVHGTLSLFRTSKCIIYSLYKNVLETLVLSLFTLLNGRSDQPIADDWTIVRYNMFFTSFTALVLGVFDRPSSLDCFTKYPKMYSHYQDSLNLSKQMSWFLCGSFQSVVLFATVSLYWKNGAPLYATTGIDGTLWVYGSLVYCVLVTVSNLKALLETNSITIWAAGATAISILLLYIFITWDSYMWPYIPIHSPAVGGLITQLPPVGCLALVLLGTVICMLPDITIKVIRGSFAADLRDSIMWAEEGRRSRLNKLYEPLFKICDMVGLKTGLDAGRNGFAFAQDDGLVVSQAQLLRDVTSSAAPAKWPDSTSPVVDPVSQNDVVERSYDDKTVENSSKSLSLKKAKAYAAADK